MRSPEIELMKQELDRLRLELKLTKMSQSSLQNKLAAVKKVSTSRLRRLKSAENELRILRRK